MESLMKKYKYQLIILLLVLFNFCVVIKNQDHYFMSQYAMVTNQKENKIEIGVKHQHKIKVYYPETEYSLLNQKIEVKMDEYIQDFNQTLSSIDVQPNQYYTLYIFYDTYSYQDYLSYVFFIESYTGGAHPSHDIWTITYDQKSNQIVTPDDLVLTNPDFLNTISSISREELLVNPGIVDTQMLMDGTTPTKDHFSRFAFSKDGLCFFFPPYQVAPYSSGSFVVVIPYTKIFS